MEIERNMNEESWEEVFFTNALTQKLLEVSVPVYLNYLKTILHEANQWRECACILVNKET